MSVRGDSREDPSFLGARVWTLTRWLHFGCWLELGTTRCHRKAICCAPDVGTNIQELI